MNAPLIIIGAPRSGTNMLRDVLVQLPGAGTWPCDEINYIWRHGNLRFTSDEFSRELATPVVRRYIRRQFVKLEQRFGLMVTLEKTCANSLRVGFVDEIFPEARYVFIVRDGVDAVSSTLKRWQASLDIPYLLKKASYVPFSDLPYYAVRYFGNRVYRLFSGERRLAFWGPQLNGMDGLLRQYSLPQVCALQWQACVENAERDFAAIDSRRVVRVRYEDFVSDPAAQLARIASKSGWDVDDVLCSTLTQNVTDRSLGRGRVSLTQAQVDDILPLIGSTLTNHGYDS